MRISPAKCLAIAALAGGLVLTGCGNTRRMMGDTIAVTANGSVVTFDRANPGSARSRSTISGLQPGETLIGADVRPGGTPAGRLYAVGNLGGLYTLDPVSGTATFLRTISVPLVGMNFGVDFNPVPDRLRIVSDAGQNLRVNVDTGVATIDGALTVNGTPTGADAVAYSNSFGAACRTTLYYIDTVSDRLLTTTNPNGGVLTVVGPLGVDAQSASGFEVATAADGTNTALAALTVAGGAPAVYTINLITGVATQNGAALPLTNDNVIALSAALPARAPDQAVGDLLAVTEMGNRLLSFMPSSPQKLCTATPIMGLAPAEQVLGIDVRPLDGALYALGSTGRVYAIDVMTGAITSTQPLSADASDLTDPFTSLSGVDFDIDFNPVPDRLRVVSNTGQNLRINVDNGTVVTDARLNPGSSAVSGAAYTNSVSAGNRAPMATTSLTTTLYDIDTAADRLVIQGLPSGDPNQGDLQGVGPSLGVMVDVVSVAGFDINGRDNVAYAALNLADASGSSLFTINLADGTATPITPSATIGGGERVRGLAFSAGLSAVVAVVLVDSMSGTQRFATLSPSNPGSFLLAPLVITGLQAGETLIGMDLRPATNVLYAASDAGRLYTLDPTSGVVTLVSSGSLVADVGDMTAPFTTLSGMAFGVDVNPQPDRLRVVSNTSQNLRANLDTLATFTDTALARPPGDVNATIAPAVVAVAYSNNFVGATTALFGIDMATSSLVQFRQIAMPMISPNDGMLATVGGLGVAFTANASFDIAGGADGYALATLQPTVANMPAVHSTLYRIDLTTGAATSLGIVGPSATSSVVKAMTILLQPSTP
jgi:hypothetical protein